MTKIRTDRRFRYTLSTQQVAEVLGVTPRTVRNMINRGELKAGTIGGTLFVHIDQLKQHLTDTIVAGMKKALDSATDV